MFLIVRIFYLLGFKVDGLSYLSVFGSENIRGIKISAKNCARIELIFTILCILCSKLRAKLKEKFVLVSDGIHCSTPSSNNERFLFALSAAYVMP